MVKKAKARKSLKSAESFLNQKIAIASRWHKLWFSCEIVHYGKSSISIFQESFASAGKIFISGEGLSFISGDRGLFPGAVIHIVLGKLFVWNSALRSFLWSFEIFLIFPNFLRS